MSIKNVISKIFDYILEWFMDLLTRRIFIAVCCMMLGLVFARSGPLTLSFGDGSNLVFFNDPPITVNNLLAKILILFGFAELISIDIIVTIIHYLLYPIRKLLMAIPAIQRLDAYISRKRQASAKEEVDED